MEDFGSGYSSLNMLKEAPVDEIKLDMRFLSAADPYGRAEEILHMIITMGNHMKLSIIAEGVETEQQKVMLQGFGCNKAQGSVYLNSCIKPSYLLLKVLFPDLSGFPHSHLANSGTFPDSHSFHEYPFHIA